MEPPEQRRRALWNILSVALPLLAVIICLITISGMESERGNVGSALAPGFLLVFGTVAGCILGFVAAVVALIRNERWGALTLLGFIGNGAVLFPLVIGEWKILISMLAWLLPG